jgi:hypothetical protein
MYVKLIFDPAPAFSEMRLVTRGTAHARLAFRRARELASNPVTVGDLRLNRDTMNALPVESHAYFLRNAGQLRGVCNLDVNRGDGGVLVQLPNVKVVTRFNTRDSTNVSVHNVNVNVCRRLIHELECCAPDKGQGGHEDHGGDSHAYHRIDMVLEGPSRVLNDDTGHDDGNRGKGITKHVKEHRSKVHVLMGAMTPMSPVPPCAL